MYLYWSKSQTVLEEGPLTGIAETLGGGCRLPQPHCCGRGTVSDPHPCLFFLQDVDIWHWQQQLEHLFWTEEGSIIHVCLAMLFPRGQEAEVSLEIPWPAHSKVQTCWLQDGAL